jgi:uncharacterized protein YoxC
MHITQGLLPIVNDAKEAFDRKLDEAPVDEATREKLAEEHLNTLKSIRRIANDLYHEHVDQKQQQLQWILTGVVDIRLSPSVFSNASARQGQLASQDATTSRAGTNARQSQHISHASTAAALWKKERSRSKSSGGREREPDKYPTI